MSKGQQQLLGPGTSALGVTRHTGWLACTCEQQVAVLTDLRCSPDAAAEMLLQRRRTTSAQRGVDWGFTTFMPLKEVLDKSKGFLKDDKLEVSLIYSIDGHLKIEQQSTDTIGHQFHTG